MKIEISERYRSYFTRVLLDTFFKKKLEQGITVENLRADINDHLENRFRNFQENMVPWVRRCQPDLSRMHVAEIGSGTGASTLAIAQVVRRVTCFEIDRVASDAAMRRLDYFHVNNVEIRNELFTSDCAFLSDSPSLDAVFFCAVLEHMTFSEFKDAVGAAWRSLRPGGLMVVADTPNRLAFLDRHTSLMPFFSMLPVEIRREYALYSPRLDFQHDITHADASEYEMLLARWGNGVSYHDFDLAIGPDFHRHIVLDGYEPELKNCAPAFIDDGILQALFAQFQIPAHRAFTRSNLYFAVRKP